MELQDSGEKRRNWRMARTTFVHSEVFAGEGATSRGGPTSATPWPWLWEWPEELRPFTTSST